jgi:uncharacterized membrane protein YedE/YeeE
VSTPWKIALPAVLANLAVVCAAAITRLWVLTAIPVGFLLGFILAKGDLCSASAMSEVILMRDGRKLWGFWVAIVTTMLSFAALDASGLMNMYPRPLEWARYLVGGALFGVGMVLAGGCVTGTIYKCGTGHLNSLVALVAIPLGINAVDLGPLAGVNEYLSGRVIGEAPVTLVSLTGLPFAAIALLFAGGTVLAAVLFGRRRSGPRGAVRRAPRDALLTRVLTRPMRPWLAGLLLGLLAVPGYLSSRASGRDFPLCVTYGVQEAELLVVTSDLDHVWRPDQERVGREAKFSAASDPRSRIYWWLVAFVLSILPGSHVAARLMGRARFYRKSPGELAAAFAGGLLVGAGAAFGAGCSLGNGVTGFALMSVGMMLFCVVALLANWATTRLWLMGR